MPNLHTHSNASDLFSFGFPCILRFSPMAITTCFNCCCCCCVCFFFVFQCKIVTRKRCIWSVFRNACGRTCIEVQRKHLAQFRCNNIERAAVSPFVIQRIRKKEEKKNNDPPWTLHVAVVAAVAVFISFRRFCRRFPFSHRFSLVISSIDGWMPKIWNAHKVLPFAFGIEQTKWQYVGPRKTSGGKTTETKKCIVLVTYFAKLPNLF